MGGGDPILRERVVEQRRVGIFNVLLIPKGVLLGEKVCDHLWSNKHNVWRCCLCSSITKSSFFPISFADKRNNWCTTLRWNRFHQDFHQKMLFPDVMPEKGWPSYAVYDNTASKKNTNRKFSESAIHVRQNPQPPVMTECLFPKSVSPAN